jgi:SAM-dependent methyltransferase
LERQLATTLDRIHPGHVERYRFAASLAKGRILDAACGCGYGSKMMEDVKCRVVGVDIDNETIQFARTYYPGPGYIIGDILDIPWAGRFDWIVSLETIEHLPDPVAVLKIFRHHGSKLIASTPNETYYPFDPKNHIGERYPHIRHYTSDEFEEVLNKCGWKVTGKYCQLHKQSPVIQGTEGKFQVFVAE